MKFGIAWTLSGLVAITLCVAWWTFREPASNGADGGIRSTHQTGGIPGGPGQSPTVTRSAPSASGTSALVDAPRGELEVSQPLSTIPHSGHGDEELIRTASAPSAPISSAGTVYAKDVIGRPFPLSLTVTDSCESELGHCEDEYRLLSRMEKEPRDERWADRAEGDLRKYFLGEGKYKIRALECRQTLCAVEVGSIHGPFLGLNIEHSDEYRLFEEESQFAYEKGAYGLQVTVTLWIARRD